METGLGVGFLGLSLGPALGLQILDIFDTFLTSKMGMHRCLPHMVAARIK